MIHQHTLRIETSGRGFFDLTGAIQRAVRESSIATGLCHVFVHHTSASVILCENADPAVQQDLEAFMQRLAPDGDPLFTHTDEGADDMPAHVRSVLTQSALTIPVRDAQCDLGTWQGIYLWEHRRASHRRRITVSVEGHAG